MSAALADLAARLGLDWLSAKTLFERAIGINDDGIHVLAGVLIQLLAALVLRRSLRHWLPLAAVFVLETINEWNDLTAEIWPGGERPMQWGEGVKDFVITLALPLLLFLIARRRPKLLTG